jgi:hypothetical protein
MVCLFFQILLPTIVGGLFLVFATAATREENFPVKSNEDSFPITRSDGTVGRMRSPDQKEVKKLVGYIRDGMNRADRSDRQRQSNKRSRK